MSDASLPLSRPDQLIIDLAADLLLAFQQHEHYPTPTILETVTLTWYNERFGDFVQLVTYWAANGDGSAEHLVWVPQPPDDAQLRVSPSELKAVKVTKQEYELLPWPELRHHLGLEDFFGQEGLWDLFHSNDTLGSERYEELCGAVEARNELLTSPATC